MHSCSTLVLLCKRCLIGWHDLEFLMCSLQMWASRLIFWLSNHLVLGEILALRIVVNWLLACTLIVMTYISLWRISIDCEAWSRCELVIHAHVVMRVHLINAGFLPLTLEFLLKSARQWPCLPLLFIFKMLMVLAYLFHLAHFLFDWILLVMILLLHPSISIRCLGPLCLGVPKLVQIVARRLPLRLHPYMLFIFGNLISDLAVLFFIVRCHDLFIHEYIVGVKGFSLL